MRSSFWMDMRITLIRHILKKYYFPRSGGVFLRQALRLFVGLFIVLGVVYCSEPDEMGLDLLHNQARFSSSDTLSIVAFTELADSIPTNFSTQNILGVINDPEFGKIKAGIFAEFRLPRNNFSLGENISFDSIMLYFGYTGKYYGQLEAFQQLRVYELSSSFPNRDTLHSNLFVPHYPDPIGERMLRPAPADSVAIDTIMFAPHFRIRLSDAFGQKIIDANGTPAFQDVNSFLDYFKGIYVEVDDQVDGIGAIYNLNMFSAFTRLSLHFSENDTLARRADFFINEFSKRSGYFENRDFSGANPLLIEQLSSPQPEIPGDSLLFVQAMGKVRANIRIPHLQRLTVVPNITINQARMVVPVADSFSGEFFPAATRLRLYRFDQNKAAVELSDIRLGEDYYGGVYNAIKKQYTFNITQYVQEIIDGKIDNLGLGLVVAGSADSAERVVVHGPGHPDRPMRLEIMYTVFD